MKGLLIKDFLLLRSYGKSLLLMFLLFLIIGATSGPAFIVGIVMIESVYISILYEQPLCYPFAILLF